MRQRWGQGWGRQGWEANSLTILFSSAVCELFIMHKHSFINWNFKKQHDTEVCFHQENDYKLEPGATIKWG